MSDIRFYHLTRQSLEQALPALLEKTIERGWRAVIRAADRERLEALDGWLWTYKDDSFLPHGLPGEHDAHQPLLLTTEDVNPNGATVTFLLDGVTESKHGFDVICLVFSGADDVAVANARAAWAKYKEAGHTLTYWQQGDNGWEKKA